jgi:GNAT superfamily N-acetyltransferase
MDSISFKLIEQDVLVIMPLLQELNTTTPKALLEERVLEMNASPNYECVGVYDGETLIGMSGLWFSTRHYCGKSVEPDHVIITEKYQGKGIGKLLFKWMDNYVQQKGCIAIELNAYTRNTAAHKFYYNDGYAILGFHFLKRF